jgi:acyloxyacyl hydrolase
MQTRNLLLPVFLLAVLAFSGAMAAPNAERDLMCAGCTLGVHLIEQVIVQQKIPDINNWIQTKLCSVFPSPLAGTCQYLIGIYGAPIIEGILKKENADVICHALPFCNNSPLCHLNPLTTPSMLSPDYLKRTATYQAASETAKSPAMAQMVHDQVRKAIASGVSEYRMNQVKKAAMASSEARQEDMSTEEKYVKAMEEARQSASTFTSLFDSPNFGYQHLPVLDIDRDHFSSGTYYRGAHWRGRDCRDLDSWVYPGRRQNPYGKPDDYNCNGIYGVHPTGPSWKQVVCDNSGQRGVGVVGDSAGAHFSIPVSWVTPANISLSTYSNLFSVINDEFDLPQNSAYTAFAETQPNALYPLRSIYKEVLRRNQCNFRDYQNLAVNGGDSYNVQTYTLSLSRNSTLDHPMVMFLELLGNDVCGPAHNLDEATPAPVFKANIYKILRELDQRLPAGSHVVILGLADGRLLYDVLHDHPHPIGGGVTYADLYTFLNCVYCNPCWGWLNTNQSVRDATTAHAMHLNQQYRDILSETGGIFKNFDFVYYDLPAQEILDTWAAQGHSRSELVEPVDGFHPNQYFLSMLSDWLVRHLDSDYPGILGPVNPNNNLITSVFGNQGGY